MKKNNEIFEQIDLKKIFQGGLYFVTFLGFLIVLLVINFCFTGIWIPSNETKDLWFWSGLVMILFTNYFIEPYYTAPTNVFANSFALVLMMISIPQNEFGSSYWWWSGIIFFSTLLFGSFLSKIIYDKNKSDDFIINKISNSLKDFLVLIGRGKVLFSLVLFYFMFLNFSENSFSNNYTLALGIFWAIVILLSPDDIKKYIEKSFFTGDKIIKNKSLGKIFAVQSDGMFLVRLFDNKVTSKFSTVIFQNQISRDHQKLFSIGFIFDVYFLNDEKWAKIIFIRKMSEEENKQINIKDYKKDFVYKTDIDYIPKEIDNFVGVVVEGSEVSRIKFEYSEKKENLEEGDLLELHTRDRKIFYQVTNGDTHKEKLESWNETGFVVGQAIQLGEWQTNLSFEKYGWVPPINTPLFKANTIEEESQIGEIVYPEYRLGLIPKTGLPSIINLHDAISHHMAILGVTGSGKSFITHEIIRELQKDTKIICIDFTGEYQQKFSENHINFCHILADPSKIPEVEKTIAELETERLKGKYSDSTKILKHKQKIQSKIGEYVQEFIKRKDVNIGLFELPEMSNTTFLLEFTQFFIEAVFNYAKYKPDKDLKIVLVLEEAHTIVPETNFLGDLGDYGSNKALVSKMSQVALQGRKYNVGLLVIGQRSANISKTVLTQCNTVISFKAFDDTSFGFLANYIGKDLVSLLPNLKQYHAIVTGKAVKSDTPMVIDFTKKQNEN